ncbi:hypothetical protein [Stenotrophomonas sp. RG-453]|uniref:hypothetical protein n=1 Tax=Stenotrophomonas sp. RG-453 TaxID=2957502 RepID=UPI0029C9C000|nr:hypothetical protein [Stenotrophomonas sp. RG-453]MDX5516174.1 hypothetical protein [Stenotrophomonas sp. RG-453]
MSESKKTCADRVRAAFEQALTEGLSYAGLYEKLAADGMDTDKAKDGINSTLRYLVARGYLLRTGEREDARFRRSGAAMARPRLTESQRAERTKAKNRRRVERARAARGATVGLRAAMIPKPVRAAPTAKPVFETYEEYRKRGGRVEYLPASWNRGQ